MRRICILMTILPSLFFTNGVAKAESNLILVDSVVPMATALRELSEQLGVVVVYEGPPYVSDAVIYRHNPNVEFYNPIGGKIMFSYNAELEPRKIIEQLLDEYNESADEATFSVVRVDDVFVVFPLAYRDEEGVLKAYQSPFDISLTLNAQDLTLSQAIQEVLQSVNAQPGVHRITFDETDVRRHLLSADFPGNLSGLTAREALVKILMELNAPLHSDEVSNPFRYTWELRTGVHRGVLSDFPNLLIFSMRDFGDMNSNRVSVERSRSILEGLKLIGEQYGFRWGYEDPLLVCPCDLFHGHASGQPLRFRFARDARARDILRKMVTSYDAQVFDVSEDSGRYRIYPVAARNVDGKVVSVKALSEVPIPSDTVAGKSMLDALSVLQVEIEAQRGKGFSVSDPVQQSAASTTLKSATSETRKAGEWLNEIVSEEDEARNWLLLYDPAKDTYELQFDDEAPEYP